MTKDEIKTLLALGFFKHVKASELPRVLAAVAESGDPFADETQRSYHVDAEDLAEGGFLDVLGCVAPLLRREGVPMDVTYAPVRFPAHGSQPSRVGTIAPDDEGWLPVEHAVKPWSLTPVEALRVAGADVTADQGDAYVLRIAPREVAIVDGASAEDAWSQASNALVTVLSEWLEAHGSAERAYGRAEGNDFTVVFATPAMAEIVGGLRSARASVGLVR